eukprot:COSAG05_NODE_4480_length_1495_cov_1.361032_1_plen_343_part_01
MHSSLLKDRCRHISRLSATAAVIRPQPGALNFPDHGRQTTTMVVATEQAVSTEIHAMDDSAKFVFDTAGYIVIEGVLTGAEVDELNGAIDAMLPSVNPTPSTSMGGRNPSFIGDRNLHTLIARYLNAQRGTSLGPVEMMDLLQQSGYPAPGRNVQFGQALTAEEKRELRAEFATRHSVPVFTAALDRLVLGGSGLSAAEKTSITGMLSTWIDDCPEHTTTEEERGIVRMGTTRTDLNGMLTWPKPHCDPFRKLLVQPKVKPYLEEICGKGFRMDHMPHVSIAHPGADGHNLHGGAAQRYGQGGFLEGYQYLNGQMYAGMVVCEFVLADEGPGDGGLAVVPGSV